MSCVWVLSGVKIHFFQKSNLIDNRNPLSFDRRIRNRCAAGVVWWAAILDISYIQIGSLTRVSFRLITRIFIVFVAMENMQFGFIIKCAYDEMVWCNGILSLFCPQDCFLIGVNVRCFAFWQLASSKKKEKENAGCYFFFLFFRFNFYLWRNKLTFESD